MMLHGILLHLMYGLNIIVADSRIAGLPLISTRHRKGIINRDRVRQLQIQSILNTIETRNIGLYTSPHFEHNVERRDLNRPPPENKQLAQVYGENIPWDIVKRQVPFHALLNHNIEPNPVHKSRRDNPFKDAGPDPCRRKRSDADIVKRHLKTPAGEGILPAVGMDAELCEDMQPVEVVQIEKLVIQDGVIRDENIIEKAMFV